MAKVILMKKAEISVPEGQKGKQIAVKENNITSLKEFYQKNYQPPQVVPQEQITESVVEQPAPLNFDNLLNTPMESQNSAPINPIDNIGNNNIIEEQVIPTENVPVQENNLINEPVNQAIETPIAPIAPTDISPISTEESDETNDAPAISLVPENGENTIEKNLAEEMDPELKEIKDRLDKVIQDLNNYKKKIKILEDEVNQNLEKSREVLKDTQAAAKIMSIQQERQKQISEELNGGGTIENDPTLTLQKDVA